MRTHLLLLLLATLAVQAAASKEGILQLGTFQLSSAGVGDSGPVTVSGARDKGHMSALCIQAFERTRCLAKEQLALLDEVAINGAQISYETGYASTGGRTVYVLLLKGFTSQRSEGRIVVVPERGTIEIQAPSVQPPK
jgi:hypothetical protein